MCVTKVLKVFRENPAVILVIEDEGTGQKDFLTSDTIEQAVYNIIKISRDTTGNEYSAKYVCEKLVSEDAECSLFKDLSIENIVCRVD